ncbi:MAG TPA: dockerin type I domain-containing protein [Candidatus Udaeobacter sp.]|jgi:hypothetical protein|nr:dockerin type I domain-containing protein [Candidatus Udaeobacter sp.]
MKKETTNVGSYLLRSAVLLILLVFVLRLMPGAFGQRAGELTKEEAHRTALAKESARADVPLKQLRPSIPDQLQLCNVAGVLGTAPAGGSTGNLSFRLIRGGFQTTCTNAPFPGVQSAGPLIYNEHRITNNTAIPLCTNVTLHYVSGGTANVNMQIAAFMAPFAAADISNSGRYLGDPGVSSGSPPVDTSFAVNVPAGATVSLVVYNVNTSPAGTGASYQIMLDQDAFCGTGPVIVNGGSALVTEGCSPGNSVIDPGEAVTVGFTLKNNGVSATTNLVATLLSSGGVTNPGSAQNYGVIASGGMATRNFTFTADSSLTCGANITATLQLSDNGNPLANITFTFTTGVLVASFSENFDSVAVPVLPAGWTADQGVNVAGAPLWQTSNSGTPLPVADSAPNSTFSQDPNNTCDNRLYTPSIMYPAGSFLVFRHNFDLEQNTAAVAYDCGVLEMNINSAGWQDILAAGGTFTQGGYNHASINAGFSNPLLPSRPNWSGMSNGSAGGFETCIVSLPAAAVGQPVRFRWRMGSDNSNGRAGWRVDNVSIAQRACCVAAPSVTSAVSRKTHGGAGTFDINLPLTGNVGVECRSGGATNDYTMVVTFANPVSVTGSPQAQVTSGTGTIGTGGAGNGGAVTVAGAVVTIPLTSVTNQQRITVKLSGVSDGAAMGDVSIPMGILNGDTNGNGTVNAGDVTQTKIQVGAVVGAGNFRTDVNNSGTLNAGDVSFVKLRTGTSLP